MAQFDPRRRPFRFAPHLLTGAAAVTTAAMLWKVLAPAPAAAGVATAQGFDPSAFAALEARAFLSAGAPAGLSVPERIKVRLRSGESVEGAVRRLGVAADDASRAAETLRQKGVAAATAFDAAIARPRVGRGPARLIGLTLRTGPATSLTLSQTFDGAMKLRELQEKIEAETTVAHGRVNGSLFQSAAALGATSAVTNQVVKLFAHKLDFSRDILGGDEFTLVFDRRVTESGRTVEIGQLIFAELESRGRPVRLYRFFRQGKPEYFDETGKNIRGFLLRTPVDGAHMTSTFGMRRHPILGFMKMHEGIDFGAGMGTPVLAAGDGVVLEAKRWGGYGNWLRIRHQNGWDTGYAHLSRYAPGIRPGMRVRQGQLVAYVGSTGRSTGPHLHYETWFKGARVNPVGARVPQGSVLTGRELAAFQAERSRIDAMVRRETIAKAEPSRKETDGLRPALFPAASLRAG